jgi:tetratricopeptide (TPR) repeat protein
VRRDPLLDVLRALAGAELDDPGVGEAELAERIVVDDRLDVLPALADGQDDPAIPGDLSTRDEERAGRVVFLQECDVRGHVGVDFREVNLVNQLDDEHRHIFSRIADSRTCSTGDDAEARLLDREKKIPEAQAAYEKAANAGSTNFRTHYRLATMIPLQGRGPEALAAADRVERDEHDKAIQAAQKAIELDPADVGSRLVAARCLAHLSRRDEALALAREALVMAHTDAERKAAQTLVSAFSSVK